MAERRDIVPRSAAWHTERTGERGVVLVLTFLFMLVAVSVSTGLVVYTALRQDLANGLFALAFAVLSARAALSWFLWSNQPVGTTTGQQNRERLKSADEINF
jgi:hypothetical protein